MYQSFNAPVFRILVLALWSGCHARSTTPLPSTLSRSTLSDLPTMWAKHSIPDPQIDVSSCGRNGRLSYVCDPNNIISSADADSMDEVIEDIRRSTGRCRCQDQQDCPRDLGYGGFHAAVAILSKLRIRANPTSEEKRDTAEDYADYLREDGWHYGLCDDDLIIVVSKEDRIVYTKTGDSMSTSLPDSCVDMIFQENKRYFREELFGEGTLRLLEEYRAVLKGERRCSGDGQETSYIAIGVVAALVLIGCAVFGICRWKGHCKSSPGANTGGSYRPPSHHTDHHVHHPSPRHSIASASSASSGGGGGSF